MYYELNTSFEEKLKKQTIVGERSRSSTRNPVREPISSCVTGDTVTSEASCPAHASGKQLCAIYTCMVVKRLGRDSADRARALHRNRAWHQSQFLMLCKHRLGSERCQQQIRVLSPGLLLQELLANWARLLETSGRKSIVLLKKNKPPKSKPPFSSSGWRCRQCASTS